MLTTSEFFKFLSNAPWYRLVTRSRLLKISSEYKKENWKNQAMVLQSVRRQWKITRREIRYIVYTPSPVSLWNLEDFMLVHKQFHKPLALIQKTYDSCGSILCSQAVSSIARCTAKAGFVQLSKHKNCRTAATPAVRLNCTAFWCHNLIRSF